MVEYSEIKNLNLEEDQMAVFNLQTALFFKQKCERPDTFSSRLNTELNGYFDAIPFILGDIPNGPGTPEELDNIPVVQMKTSNSADQFNVARTRCDIVLAFQGSDLNQQGDFLDKSKAFLLNFIEKALQLDDFYRIGVIANSFEQESNPSSRILKKYFNPGIKFGSEVSFRINTPVQRLGVRINDILSISEGQLQQGRNSISKPYKGILVNRDVNTMPNSNEILNFKTAKIVIEYAFSQFQDNKIGEVR